MKLEQAIHDRGLAGRLRAASVICIRAVEYPPLFCRALIRYFSQLAQQPIISYDREYDQHVDHMASLQTTFLGTTCWYWLHADIGMTKKTADEWLAFLHHYKGPHTLIFCTTQALEKIPTQWQVLQLPITLDRPTLRRLTPIIGTHVAQWEEALFKMVPTIPLDTAILLDHYAQLVGKKSELFVTTWLGQLVTPEISLFSLSQALFGRNAAQFFRYWKHLKGLYAVQFWISFWSEQLWRAYCYIRLQKSGQIADAKKIGYRLPFSFLKGQWRTVSLQELTTAHAFLYELDYHCKHGGSEEYLELFYARFLNKA
jgi:hypothetical protein